MIGWLGFLMVQAATVAIPLGTYSYPEIAERLSTPELKITVESSLRERGALVCIHDRSRTKALDAICHGLDLTAVSKDDAHIQLRVDPVVAKRENQWRSGLLDNLNSKWRSQLGELSDLTKLDNAGLNARLALTQKKPMTTDGWDNLCISFLFRDENVLRTLPLLRDSAPALSSSLFTDQVEQDEVTGPLPADLVKELRLLVAPVQIQDPIYLKRLLAREPGQLRLNTYLFASDPNGSLVELHSPPYWTMLGARRYTDRHRSLFSQLANGDLESRLPPIGKDCPAWLDASEKATRMALNDNSLAEPLTIDGPDGSLSGVVKQWAKGSGKDVVMELAPIGEDLDDRARYLPSGYRVTSVSDCIALDDSWGLEQVEGILIVRNRMAFLDRTSDCPVGDIASYLRRCPDRLCSDYARLFAPDTQPLDALDAAPGLPLIEDVLPLIRLRLDRSLSSQPWLGVRGYRGLTNLYLESYPALLWPGLPQDTLRTIRGQSEGTLKIPTSDFDQQAVDETVEGSGWPDRSPSQLQTARETLAKDTASIWWKRVDGGEIIVFLSLDSGLGNAAFRIKL